MAGTLPVTMLAEIEGLEEVAEDVYVRYLLTLGDAIDLFTSSGLAPKTRADYTRLLDKFAEPFPVMQDVAKITDEDILRFLSGRRSLAQGTRAWQETVLSSFFRWLYRSRRIKTNPMEFVPRTRRPDPDSLDLVTVSSEEVVRMLDATDTWAEKICIGVLAYLGPRRGAVAKLRLSDWDRDRGRLRFHEKGGKTIWKPVPDALNVLLEAALAAGVYQDGAGECRGSAETRGHIRQRPPIESPVSGSAEGAATPDPYPQDGVGEESTSLSSGAGASGRNPGLPVDPYQDGVLSETGRRLSPELRGATTASRGAGLPKSTFGSGPCPVSESDPYLVPPEGPLARHGERDDRVIWRLVKRVADRAGVNCHVHALRAAFADFYLDSGGDGKALQLLLGHKNPATTERYTRRFDRERRMDSVRSLSWGKKP